MTAIDIKEGELSQTFENDDSSKWESSRSLTEFLSKRCIMQQGISSDSYQHKRRGIIPDFEDDDSSKWEFSQFVN